MKIEIAAYNPEWANQFRFIKGELNIILGKLAPRIEHIGSTSVPNLAAKPVIDIAVGINSSNDLDETIEPMIRNHYLYFEVYNAAMPLRRLFVGLKDKKEYTRFKSIYTKNDIIPHEEINSHRLVHVHVWKFGTPEWIRHIAFRDYLIAHPEIKSQYEALKKQLSLKDWKDTMEYNAGKNSFIKEQEAKAILWYAGK
ncbi:MAG: GrpB family protein [Saprospirales bacterium]|nr:GrpB family protein [Saprospirales bacterium]